MLSTAYYFLQVIFCSAVMMGYYWFVLRDKKFHQYNRFYLLSVLVLSWIIPMIKIQWTKPVTSDAQVINLISIVADNNAEIDANLAKTSYPFTWEGFAVAVYFLIAAIMLGLLIFGLFRLYVLLKKHSCKNVGDVYLILTQVKGTPFSFFRYIFWHEAIDLRSDAGKKMLAHELTHVKQKHSLDKVLIQVVLVAGWFNPFFWLLKKEMEMIHEFIADNKTVQNGDSASLAALLLTAAYPQQQFLLTTPFFFSPIKRRLAMITNHKTPRFSYVRRLVILPILALVVILVAFRKKETEPTRLSSIQLNKTYTIVIDAGHGGKDRGAFSPTSKVTEAELTLQFAKAVKAENKNTNIKIILTRETDVFNSVQEKADFANAQKADLFISLHCNNAEPIQHENGKKEESPAKGMEIYIANKEKAVNYSANAIFANELANSIKNLNHFSGIKSRNAGIWVLQAVKCPSVIIEAGFMTNQEDLKLMLDAGYQKKFADGLLEGVESYLSNMEHVQLDRKDLIVQDQHMNVTVGQSQLIKQEVRKLIVTDTNSPKINLHGPVTPIGKNAIIYLDGVKIDSISFHKLNPDQIERVEVWKGEEGVKKFGKEGEHGVVLITSKHQPTDVKLENVDYPSNKDSQIKKVQLIDAKAVYYIDGVKSDSATMQKLDPQKIEIVNVWKGKDAVERFGKDGSNGVIDIKLKKQEKK